METDEKQLILKAQNGNLQAFKMLVEQNKMNIYQLAYNLTRNKEDAEDVTQEVFIKAFRSISKFRGDSKFSTWLYRITVNTSLSLKKRYKIVDIKSEENMDLAYKSELNQNHSIEFNPEKLAESMFIKKHINNALSKLSKLEKTVFVLKNYDELNYDEIQTITNLKSGTLRSLNFRAIKKLQIALDIFSDRKKSEAVNG